MATITLVGDEVVLVSEWRNPADSNRAANSVSASTASAPATTWGWSNTTALRPRVAPHDRGHQVAVPATNIDQLAHIRQVVGLDRRSVELPGQIAHDIVEERALPRAASGVSPNVRAVTPR